MNLNNPKILWDLLAEFPDLRNRISLQKAEHKIQEATQLTELPDLKIENHKFYSQRTFIKAITYLMVRNPPIILFYNNNIITLKRVGKEWIAIQYQYPTNVRRQN